ncbi:MAG: dual specificity protein phosphatase family protein [Vicinamibacterales bacterium]
MPFSFPIQPSRISPGLLAGPAPRTDQDVARLGGEGVTDVLDLRRDKEWQGRSAEAAVQELEAHGITRHSVPMVDHQPPSPETLAEAVDLIDAIVGQEDDEGGGTPERVLYVHCHAGIERTGAVLVAWYARRHHLTYTEALEALRKKRPALDPLPEQEKVVREFLVIS